MKNQNIADIFANSNREASTKHLFIEGDSIYSYGYHFKIAEKTGPKIANFTTRGYSSTTSVHKGRVKRALVEAGYTLIESKL